MPIPFTDDELFPAAERSISKIEPMLALDGGSIKLLTVKNGVVYVQLGGLHRVSKCRNIYKYGVEKKIREDIHQELCVINVPIRAELELDEFIRSLENRK